MLAGVRALLFDLDGTLLRPAIDFEEMRRVVLAIVHRYGVDTGRLEELPVLELVEGARAQLHARDDAREWALAEEVDAAVAEIELAAAARARPFRGVPSMLRRLAADGYRVGIVTRNCRPAVERALARSPLVHHVLLTRDDVPQPKPDPAHLLAALRALGAQPAEAAMVGDHVLDVLAGRRAGLRTVAVLGEGGDRTRFAAQPPDLLLDKVTDLPAHLDLPAPAPATGG